MLRTVASIPACTVGAQRRFVSDCVILALTCPDIVLPWSEYLVRIAPLVDNITIIPGEQLIIRPLVRTSLI